MFTNVLNEFPLTLTINISYVNKKYIKHYTHLYNNNLIINL